MNNKTKKYQYQFIYIIENQINNKAYVGFHSTNNLNDGYLGSGIAISKAITKYGEKNFRKTILEHCYNSNWQEREIFWIKEKDTFGKNGYNLTTGGEGGFNKIISKMGRKNMSIAATGRKLSTETKKKLSIASMGNIPTNKGIPGLQSKEGRKRISETHKGKSKSLDHRQKIGESRIGLIYDKIECPHCHSMADPGNFKRWHGDNCKYDESII